MARFGAREEIEVALRYIKRVRAMQPSAAALRDLDEQEAGLKRQLRALDDSTVTERPGGVSLHATTSLAKRRSVGFSS